MVRKETLVVTVEDDFDGNPIDEGLAQTIDFAWEGSSYTIDLRPANADKFRKDMTKWLEAATKVTGQRGRPKGSGSSRPGTGSERSSEELQAIREWARANGHTVSDRGRVKKSIQDAYDEAHAPAST